MLVDCGFFDKDGNYIEDIQEIDEMEMKEIIIDGVKVSECSYYSSENYPYTCEVWDNECEAQNCYYKQLKRKEQENAELKNQIRIAGIIIEQANDKIPKYKQTLNAIKECLKDWEKAYMTFGFNEYDEILEKMSNLIKESEV